MDNLDRLVYRQLIVHTAVTVMKTTTVGLLQIVLPALFTVNLHAADEPPAEQAADETTIEEILVTNAPPGNPIRRGWEPADADEVDVEIQRTYNWLEIMNSYAEACDIESIGFLQTYQQRRPCEAFVESVNAFFPYYRDACIALTEWHQRFSDELARIEDVETEYAGTLNWMALTRENISITCNMSTIRETKPEFDTHITQLERIVSFINSDSWLGNEGAPRALRRSVGPATPNEPTSRIPAGPN